MDWSLEKAHTLCRHAWANFPLYEGSIVVGQHVNLDHPGWKFSRLKRIDHGRTLEVGEDLNVYYDCLSFPVDGGWFSQRCELALGPKDRRPSSRCQNNPPRPWRLISVD